MDLAAPLQETEHWNLAALAPPAPALSDLAEIAHVHLDLAGHQLGRLGVELISNKLSQLVELQGRRVSETSRRQRNT